MDPITTAIVAALPALASDLVKSSVKDAYAGLKSIICRKWGDTSAVAKSVDALEANPKSKGQAAVLSEHVNAVNAMADVEVMQALAKLVDALKKEGWVGDVLFRPYSEHKPIVIDSGIRAVTLFEISELIEICRKGGSYIVLISGPSSRSATMSTKSDSLRPLLSQDLRVWTHLVTDSATAIEVLQD